MLCDIYILFEAMKRNAQEELKNSYRNGRTKDVFESPWLKNTERAYECMVALQYSPDLEVKASIDDRPVKRTPKHGQKPVRALTFGSRTPESG